jgi:hypothetical protein
MENDKWKMENRRWDWRDWLATPDEPSPRAWVHAPALSQKAQKERGNKNPPVLQALQQQLLGSMD